MRPVAFGLGSNLGDRRVHLARAARSLLDRLQNGRVSSLYESDAVGGPEQGPFLNVVVVGATDADLDEMRDWIRELERREGRVRRERWGPRTLDVDLLLWGELELESGGFRVPHPRWRERDFVVVPLAEVAPDWVDPETGRTVGEVLDERRLRSDPEPHASVVRVQPSDWVETVSC